MPTELNSISDLLAESVTADFATADKAPARGLRLEVEGAGRIGFPVSAATARRLCKIAQPARHGFKDQTRLDRKVRDTWEIRKEQITIDGDRWKQALAKALLPGANYLGRVVAAAVVKHGQAARAQVRRGQGGQGLVQVRAVIPGIKQNFPAPLGRRAG